MTGLVAEKVALVTGGGSGIGRAAAILLGREGAAGVVVADIDDVGARETVRKLESQGTNATAVVADVAVAGDAHHVVDQAVQTYGRLDCAVNSAGIRGPYRPLSECTDDEWRRVIGVNLDGMFYCLRSEMRAMRAFGNGSIVNISSGTTVSPTPGLGPYAASKFGVLGLTKVAAGEGATYGVRVNAVLPGITRTPLVEANLDPAIEKRTMARMPPGRLGRPEEIAEAIVWLCSSRSSYVNAATLLVDGGMHSVEPFPDSGQHASPLE